MQGINLSTAIGDAFQLTATSGAPVQITPTPGKSMMLVVIAPTGTQFWIRQSASFGALPSNANVVAKPPDLTTITNDVHLLDVARILDPVLGLYTTGTSVAVTAFEYGHGYITPETGSVLVKTIMDKLLRVA